MLLLICKVYFIEAYDCLCAENPLLTQAVAYVQVYHYWTILVAYVQISPY